MWYCSINHIKIASAFSVSFCGAVGYITVLNKNFPVGSTIANLQPVLKAGSNPSTVFHWIGGVRSRFFKFSPNTLIAASSAHLFLSALNSLSIDGISNLFKPSSIAQSRYSTLVHSHFHPFGMKYSFAHSSVCSHEKSIIRFNCFSFSALSNAKKA
jgi:hypothetical protein